MFVDLELWKCTKVNSTPTEIRISLYGTQTTDITIVMGESTVIERRQQQLGRMADFLPPVTFSVFDL